MWHSWLDRDLSLAGRVVVSQQSGGFTSKLIKIDRPILRIPTLAIHRERVFREYDNKLLLNDTLTSGPKC